MRFLSRTRRIAEKLAVEVLSFPAIFTTDRDTLPSMGLMAATSVLTASVWLPLVFYSALIQNLEESNNEKP